MPVFQQTELQNGLKLFFIEDKTTPFAVVNLLYDVGSKDEHPDHTGFAHLFEHLMFGGSKNVPFFDQVINGAGGESNAFTNSDFTNYYITLPKENLDVALWVEADRMQSLIFSSERLEVQRKVVIEEYKQQYLNQPYGDIWLLLRPLAYQKHPYRWCTIGKDMKSIEQASLQEVESFFKNFYMPNNAVLCIVGNFSWNTVKQKAEDYFGDIACGNRPQRLLPQEPLPQTDRILSVEREVPADGLLMAFPMCKRLDSDFHTYDLLSNVLCNGNSSWLYDELCEKKKIFTEIDAYITGEVDNGLLVVGGKLAKNIKMEEAEQALNEQLSFVAHHTLDESKVQKVKNLAEAFRVFSGMTALDKAMNLSLFSLLGNPNLINTEKELYDRISAEDIQRVAMRTFEEQKRYVLRYYSKS